MSSIEEIREEYKQLVSSLQLLRDELRVNMHLASLEIQEEWAELEKKWVHLKAQSERILDVAEDSSEDIHEAASLLGSEIKQAYYRLKALL